MSSKRVLWSAGDPGGKNAIMPVVEALIARGDEASENLASPDVFLAGTSASPDSQDKKFLERHPEVPSVYVLDFWGNYRVRFLTSEGALLIPNVLCVMDEEAKKGAIAEGIPAERIVVTGNPYWDHFADGITRDGEDKHRILFISQPVRAGVGERYGFDEYTAVTDVIAAMGALPARYRLGIRLHPLDEPHKYDTYLNERVFLVEGTLEENISAAGLVIGMFSPVLMQAAAAGKPVLSYEPDSTVDMLPTNRLGLTRRATSSQELRDTLARYATGRHAGAPVAIERYWPKGATERVLKVIDTIV